MNSESENDTDEEKMWSAARGAAPPKEFESRVWTRIRQTRSASRWMTAVWALAAAAILLVALPLFKHTVAPAPAPISVPEPAGPADNESIEMTAAAILFDWDTREYEDVLNVLDDESESNFEGGST